MNTALHNFLMGVGSLLAIFPRGGYEQFVNRSAPSQRLPTYFSRVGMYAAKSAREIREQAKSRQKQHNG